MSTQDILNERGKTHGDFTDNSRVMVETLRVWGILPRESNLSDVQIAALIYDAGKTSRIVSGNADFIDVWRDRAGYNQLVVDRLQKTPGAVDAKQEYIVIE